LLLVLEPPIVPKDETTGQSWNFSDDSAVPTLDADEILDDTALSPSSSDNSLTERKPEGQRIGRFIIDAADEQAADRKGRFQVSDAPGAAETEVPKAIPHPEKEGPDTDNVRRGRFEVTAVETLEAKMERMIKSLEDECKMLNEPEKALSLLSELRASVLPQQ
jgi:hypothetical protein